MNPRDDDTSIGAILLQLGILTPEQLEIALEKQHNSTFEERLGMVLVHIGFCSAEDVDLALSAQRSVRSAKEGDRDRQRAVAAIDLAISRKRSNGARSNALQRGVEFIKHQTGDAFQAITPELLAKGSNGR
jgi:hypothetical protein